MSETASVHPSVLPAPGTGALWRRQIAAILRLELRRSFLGARALLLYLAALAPVGLAAIYAVMALYLAEGKETIQSASKFYAAIYQPFLLTMIVFFGCTWVFSNLIRGEVLDRSLHYYFLAPVRREVLISGKFLAGLVGSALLFGASTVASYLLMYLPFGNAAIHTHLLGGPGLGHLFTYLGITLLACLGYGSVFLLVGLVFRNPILPAFLLLVWEWLNFLLPPLLKKLSVIHYLKALCPVPMSDGPFAVLSEPPSAVTSVLGLLVFAAVVLVLATLRIRHMEVDYAND